MARPPNQTSHVDEGPGLRDPCRFWCMAPRQRPSTDEHLRRSGEESVVSSTRPGVPPGRVHIAEICSRADTGAARVVISDLNASYGSTHYPPAVGHALEQITDVWRPDLVLAAGDLIAGQAPQLPDSAVRAMWTAFDSTVAAPLREARIPLVVTLGNHDASAYPAHARDRRLALEYWRARSRGADIPFVDREHYPLRYTLRRGDVFVAVWDATNQESATDRELLRWLRDALSSSEARRARHRVVLGHLPLYAVAEGRDRTGEVLAQGDSLRQRLEAWGATLFISGHHHAYYPGRRGELELLYAGALGDGPRPLIGAGMPARNTVSVLDFFADSLAITTYGVDPDTGEMELLPLQSLPRAICSSSGWVARRDLIPVDTACVRRAPPA